MPGVVSACVFTVSAAVTAEIPEIDADWVTEHAGGSVAPAGPVTAHRRITIPVNPLAGVMVIFEVAVVLEASGVVWLACSENVPAG